MEDFSLVATSGLPSLDRLFGTYDKPSWNRSLRELKVASDSLWNAASANHYSASSEADLGTSSFLRVRRAPDLDGLAASKENGSSQPSAENDFLQWEEANRRKEVDILKRIVVSAEARTRQRSLDLFEKQMQAGWEKTRDLWKNELVGTRNLGLGLGVSSSENGQQKNDSALPLENSVNHAPLLSSSLDQLNLISTSAVDGFVDPMSALGHLDILKQLQEKNGQSRSLSLAEAAKQIAKISSRDNSPQSTCYRTALQIVARILSRPSYSPIEVALATLDHFSGQFDSFVMGRVLKAGLELGELKPSVLKYKNRKANSIASFVSLELGAVGEASLWPCLYYCKLCLPIVYMYIYIFRLTYHFTCTFSYDMKA